jgi:hypothetical protein
MLGHLIRLVLVALLAGACSTPSEESPEWARSEIPLAAGPTGYREFVPVDAEPSPTVTYFDPSSGQQVTRAWATMSNDEVRRILSLIHTDISVAKRTSSGELDYLVAKATAEKGNYRVVMDYSQFVPEAVTDKGTGSEIARGRVGIGMRMTADFHTLAADVDLGSVFKLGVAASNSQLRGTMSVDIIGIESADIGNLVVTSSQIDETSIQKTLEAMAAIKAKIPEPATRLTPYLLAVKPLQASLTPNDAKKAIQRNGAVASLAKAAMKEPSGLCSSGLSDESDGPGALALAVDDDRSTVFVLARQADGSLGAVRALPISIGGSSNEDMEINDLESITWDRAKYYFAAGSHRSSASKQAKTRHLLRLTIDPAHWADANYTVASEDRDIGAALVAYLHTQGVVVSEEKWKKDADPPANGDWHPYAMEIEGLAVRKDRLLLGLKWPLKDDGAAIVVEYDWSDGPNGKFTRIWFLGLDSQQGISELTYDSDASQLLVVGNLPAKVREGDSGDDKRLTGKSVVYTFDDSGDKFTLKSKTAALGRDGAKLEGLAIMPNGKGGVDLWLGYDGRTSGLATHQGHPIKE